METVRTTIKEDLSPDINPLDYAIRYLESKTNTTSHPNIGLLKTAREGIELNVWRIYFEGMRIVSKAYRYNN